MKGLLARMPGGTRGRRHPISMGRLRPAVPARVPARISGPVPATLSAAILLGAVLGILAGCASSPQSDFYTLTSLPAAERRPPQGGGAVALGLGPVTFPEYLDRPQLVSRDTANRLDVDEFNRWGGTLKSDFVRVWSENLALLLGTGRILVFPSEVRYPIDFRVSVDVLSFEGIDGPAGTGTALLKVRWAVLDPRLETALSVNEGTYRQPYLTAAPPGAGPRVAIGRSDSPPSRASLVAAMSAALGEFSRDVAAAVRALPKPAPPPEEERLFR